MPTEFEFPSGRVMWAPLVMPESYKRDRHSAYMKVIERLQREYAAQRLAPYKVPKRFEFIDALPRNAMGKVVRGDL